MIQHIVQACAKVRAFLNSGEIAHSAQVPGMAEVLLIGNVDQADMAAFVARLSRQENIKIRCGPSLQWHLLMH